MKSYTQRTSHTAWPRVAASANHRTSLLQGWKIVFCMLPGISGLSLLGRLLQGEVNGSNGKKEEKSVIRILTNSLFLQGISLPFPKLRRERQIP